MPARGPTSTEVDKQFEELAFPLTDQLFSVALKMTHDRFDAEDLVQETFLKAYRFFHTYKRGTNFKSWIFRILTNSYINHYRKQKRQPQRVDFETAVATLGNNERSGWQTGEDAQAVAADYRELFDDTIAEALERLPEHYRLVVLLSDVGDLRYKEIAAVLGIPLGTVMSRLSRGRHMLAQRLKEYATENNYLLRR